jgi:Ni/Co efflux regulator RcnB
MKPLRDMLLIAALALVGSSLLAAPQDTTSGQATTSRTLTVRLAQDRDNDKDRDKDKEKQRRRRRHHNRKRRHHRPRAATGRFPESLGSPSLPART